MQSVIDNQVPKDFVVLLDPKSGQLIKNSNKVDKNKTQIKDKPLTDPKLGYIDFNGMIFKDFPDKNPEINFLDALKSSVISSPIMAKMLIGVLLVSSEENSKTELIWCITGFGLPPIESGGFYVPDGKKQYRPKYENFCSVIDAKTGEFLYATSK